jgi:hypothetical protein
MRNGKSIVRVIATLTMAIAGQAALAIEFGLEGGTSNLQFPWTPVSPITKNTFPASNFFVGGQAWMIAPLGEDASIKVSLQRDQVTRNCAIGIVQFERGIARISVGPLFGFLNTDAVPFSMGLSASVRLQWPGVAYISMRSDGGTAISVLQTADPQAMTELAAGVYVPHAIVSGLISAKRFNEVDSSGGLVTDSLTRYAMTIDIFKKNVPYTALLSLGFERRAKHYETADVTDSLGAVVLGLYSTVQLNRAFKLLLDTSTGAYVFGLDELKGRGPSNSSFLFSAFAGASVDVTELKLMPKREKKVKAKKASAEAPADAPAEAPAEAPPK